MQQLYLLQADSFMRRFLLLTLVTLITATLSAAGQEVYIASWTIQDVNHSLEQELAVKIIEQANVWLTRENSEAPTARLDDRLRVTVVGIYNPTNGTVRERISQLNLGGLLIEEGFESFLDSSLMNEIIRRSCFWREESLTVLDASLSPSYRRVERQVFNPKAPPTYDKAFAPAQLRRPIFGLNHTAIPLTDRMQLWGGIGYEEMGLPGLSYRRARLGIESGNVRAWGELPLPISVGSALTGTNEAAPGVGLSFELGRFGGGVTWSDPYAVSNIENDTGYVMNTSALLYGIVPIDYISPLKGWLRVKFGAGYLQGTTLVRDDSDSIAPGETLDFPRPFVRGEFLALRSDGTQERSANLEIFGSSLIASYYQRVTERLQIGITGAVHIDGPLGERPPFAPGSSLWLDFILQ